MDGRPCRAPEHGGRKLHIYQGRRDAHMSSDVHERVMKMSVFYCVMVSVKRKSHAARETRER
jgi:hypothetical protein